LLIFDLSLKSSNSAKQAQFRNQKSSIVNRQSSINEVERGTSRQIAAQLAL